MYHKRILVNGSFLSLSHSPPLILKRCQQGSMTEWWVLLLGPKIETPDIFCNVCITFLFFLFLSELSLFSQAHTVSQSFFLGLGLVQDSNFHLKHLPLPTSLQGHDNLRKEALLLVASQASLMPHFCLTQPVITYCTDITHELLKEPWLHLDSGT